MKFFSFKKVFALTVAISLSMVLVSGNCFALSLRVTNKNSTSNGNLSMGAADFGSYSQCGSAALKFYARGWTQKDSSHMFVGWSDLWETWYGGSSERLSAIRKSIEQSYGGLRPVIPAHIDGNGNVVLCITDEFRLMVMAHLALEDLDTTLDGAQIGIEEILAAIADGVIYLGGGPIVALTAAIAGTTIGVSSIVIGTMDDYKDDADQYIKDHLFLWYTGEVSVISGDNDNDGYSESQGDQNDNDRHVFPGSAWPLNDLQDDPGTFVDPADGDPNHPGNADDTYVDPVTNHKHAIGMHSVRGRLQGHSTWKYEISVEEGTSLHLNMRVKVKEKEDRDWEDVYVDLYYSPNRWFSRTHDTLIETLKINTLDADEKESRYFDDINISNLEPGNHYYFADIRYGDEHNISSRKDDTEYLKLTIVAPAEPIVLPDYTYNKTETCANLTYDETDWTFTRYDVKTVFNLGEDIHAITEINNVRVDHKMKMEVYHNGEYWWTEEDSAWRVVTDYWGQSYMWVGQNAEEVGIFMFKTYIDLGSGWELLSEVSAEVEDPNAPTDPYIFNGTQTCANVTYDETVWQHFVGTPKSVFSLNEEIWVLAEVSDIITDYRLKIEVWVNGYHWWTEGENSSFTQVNGTEDRAYLHLSQEAEETGTFTFKTFIDTGNGWQSLGETSATVQ